MRIAAIALTVLVSTTTLAVDKPTFTCGVRSKVDRGRYGMEARIRCSSFHVNNIPEWRLYGANEDMLTDFDEGRQFEFLAPDMWRLLEMRALDDEENETRARVWVRIHSGKVEWKQYGNE